MTKKAVTLSKLSVTSFLTEITTYFIELEKKRLYFELSYLDYKFWRTYQILINRLIFNGLPFKPDLETLIPIRTHAKLSRLNDQTILKSETLAIGVRELLISTEESLLNNFTYNVELNCLNKIIRFESIALTHDENDPYIKLVLLNVTDENKRKLFFVISHELTHIVKTICKLITSESKEEMLTAMLGVDFSKEWNRLFHRFLDFERLSRKQLHFTLSSSETKLWSENYLTILRAIFNLSFSKNLEKRSSVRVPINLPVEIIFSKKNPHRSLTTYTKNISLDGICTVVYEKLDNELPVKLILHFPTEQIVIDSRVKWISMKSNLVGFEFRNIPAKKKELLFEMIFKFLREAILLKTLV